MEKEAQKGCGGSILLRCCECDRKCFITCKQAQCGIVAMVSGYGGRSGFPGCTLFSGVERTGLPVQD